MNRRSFVKKIAGASLAVGFPTLIPASALGKDGNVAPSNRIHMGSIGLGNQGTGITKGFHYDKRVQLVALCDVNNTTGTQYYGYNHDMQKGLQVARKEFGMDIACFNDYRELLEQPDIQAICTATPDHWHAIVGIDCIKAGKDVYGEKPLTRTIHEGQLLRDTVVRAGAIWQTGSQQRSGAQFLRAAEIINSGVLGKIKNIKIGLPANFPAEVLKPQEVPEGLDWERWQGPAPSRVPYHPYKAFTTWRGIFEYSSGKISDWGAHHIDIAQWSMGIDENGGPSEIVPYMVQWPKNGFADQPNHFGIKYYYDNGVEIDMSTKNMNGVDYYGEKGRLFVNRDTLYSDPIDLCEVKIDPKSPRLYPLRNVGHQAAFINSVIDRRVTATDIKIAHRTNSACLLGEIAYRLGRPIKWDYKKEEFINDPQASTYLRREYTAPWHLA